MSAAAGLTQADAAAAAKQDGAEAEIKATRRASKKRGDRRAAHGDEVEAKQEDFVRIVPYKKPPAEKEGWQPVGLSKSNKAPQLQLSDDRMSVTGCKGYRMARATHGAHEGTWYCEVTINHLGETGHCRLGWATAKAELQAPVGFDAFGFAYRDLEGCKVHKALREDYGEPYGEGDVIGLLLHMPPGGRRVEAGEGPIVRYKGALYTMQEEEQEARPLTGSGVAFARNGALQGVAYRDISEGTYYPAASLYTRHRQLEGSTVTFNFGPNFKHAAPQVEGWPDARPLSDLAGPPPPDAAGGAAGGASAATDAVGAGAAAGAAGGGVGGS